MGSVVGRTATDLDGRFSCVRTGESNLGNLVRAPPFLRYRLWLCVCAEELLSACTLLSMPSTVTPSLPLWQLCDIWRQACHADVALLNGGTLRSDRIHPAGACAVSRARLALPRSCCALASAIKRPLLPPLTCRRADAQGPDTDPAHAG